MGKCTCGSSKKFPRELPTLISMCGTPFLQMSIPSAWLLALSALAHSWWLESQSTQATLESEVSCLVFAEGSCSLPCGYQTNFAEHHL